MTATPLQTLLALAPLSPLSRTSLEVLLMLIAALFALALRNRKEPIRGGAFILIALGLTLDQVASNVGSDKLALSLEAGALVIFLFGAIRLLLEALDIVMARRSVHFSTIFRDLLMVVLYAVVVLVVLRSTVKVDLTPLLATSAVLTVVLGLGLQETLGNIFSGLTLQMQKPFAPGDWVRFQHHLGRVQGIGWRATRLITRANERLEIPNSMLAKDILTNYETGAVADEIFVGLPYSEPPNKVKQVILEVAAHVPEILKTPASEVMVSAYEDSAIKYRLKFWITDYGRQDKIRDALQTALWYALRRGSIEVPFPTRTVHMHQERSSEEVNSERDQRLIKELRHADFLAPLTDEELLLLLPHARVHYFGGGETIVHEGEIGECFYVLRKGTVQVLAETDNGGGPVTVRDMKAPNFFGEISLMTGEKRTASIRALTDVEVLEITRDGFSQLFQAHPEAAQSVEPIIAMRLQETTERRAVGSAQNSESSRDSWLMAKMRKIFDFE